MDSNKGSVNFLRALEPILRKLIENIESPFVWTPLGFSVLCVLAYPITKFGAFLYLSMVFMCLAFCADWVGRWKNRQTPPRPIPQKASYRDDVFNYLASVQAKAVAMLEKGKPSAAKALTDKNLQAVDETLKAFPNDADFHALMGYTLKDVFQSSKNLLSADQRQAYLGRARKSFEHALRLDRSIRLKKRIAFWTEALVFSFRYPSSDIVGAGKVSICLVSAARGTARQSCLHLVGLRRARCSGALFNALYRKGA